MGMHRSVPNLWSASVEMLLQARCRSRRSSRREGCAARRRHPDRSGHAGFAPGGGHALGQDASPDGSRRPVWCRTRWICTDGPPSGGARAPPEGSGGGRRR